MNRSVSEIFDPPPSSWGLRGDPGFWDDLKRHFENARLPYPADAFEEEVKRLFAQTTGEALTRDCRVYVEKYAHGGMSNGMVSGSYWVEQGIPLLRDRLERANKPASCEDCADGRQDVHVFEYEEQARQAGIAMIVTSLVFLIIGALGAWLNPSLSFFLFALFALIWLPLCVVGTL